MLKHLKSLHNVNAWGVLYLFISGLLLYIPALRGPLAPIRLFLVNLHTYAGIVPLLVLFIYLPAFRGHWNHLESQNYKKINLSLVAVLLIGWSVSGVLLWRKTSISLELAQTALFYHDLFTWLGIPYLLLHSFNRWPKLAQGKLVANEIQDESPVSRRKFVRWIVGLAAFIGLGSLIRSIEKLGNSVDPKILNECGKFEPLPTPAPASKPPIGGGSKGEFRIYSITKQPCLTDANWSLEVTGLVDKPLNLDWNSFLELPRTVQVKDFHCVTGWSVFNVTYEGITLAQMLKMAGIKPEAKYVKFYSKDKYYTDALSLEQALLDDVMIALLMDGEMITTEYGGPVRLIVPKMYGYKAVKWLNQIELIDASHEGYWERQGYAVDAWVPEKELLRRGEENE